MFADAIENFNSNNVIISDPIKNSMIEQSLFYKFLYSNEFVSFNGIFLYFQLENISFNKDRIILSKDNQNNINIFNLIINIENSLFNIININKKKNYKLKELINNNNIKFSKSDIYNIHEFNQLEELEKLEKSGELTELKKLEEFSKKIKHNFILKLSGIWETNDNIGITFKIILINKILDFN